MRSLMFVPLVVVWVGFSVAAADVKPPAPAMKGVEMKGSDSSMMAKCVATEKNCPEKAGGRCCAERGSAWGDRGSMGRQFPGFVPMNPNEPNWRMHAMAGMSPRHMMMVHKFFHLFIFLILVVNILLTILVSLDMAKRAKFNGLWIPILLIVGIPGTAIYALFRIGDSIAEAKRS